MSLVPHCLILCDLAGGQALLVQGSPTRGAPCSSADGWKTAAQAGEATGNSAGDHTQSRYQYVDGFPAPAWAVDPKQMYWNNWSWIHFSITPIT